MLLMKLELVAAAVAGGGPLSKFNGTIKGASGAKSGIETLLGTVLTGVRLVGAGLAICILSYVGIKYMLASAGERAELKNYMLRYVIGAVILISATFIVTELIKLAQSITGT